MIVMFAKPVSLKPYYELYKEQPRLAMRQVNDIVRGEIERMMLNIGDLDNYKEIDFLRTTSFGDLFASAQGYDPKVLTQKLTSDKNLVAALGAAAIDSPDELKDIYAMAKELRKGVKKLGVDESMVATKASTTKLIGRCLIDLLGLPVALFAAGPTLLVFLVPWLLNSFLVKDKQFRGSINLASLLLVTYPLCGIVPVIVMLCGGHLFSALGYLLLFPLMVIFEWDYGKHVFNTARYARACSAEGGSKLKALRALRKEMFERLGALLSVK